MLCFDALIFLKHLFFYLKALLLKESIVPINHVFFWFEENVLIMQAYLYRCVCVCVCFMSV